jgi:hypothetical protein
MQDGGEFRNAVWGYTTALENNNVGKIKPLINFTPYAKRKGR